MKKLLLIAIIIIPTLLMGQEPNWKLGISVSPSQKNLEQFFKHAKKVGFHYLECGLPSNRSDIKRSVEMLSEYKRLADKHGLEFWSVHIPFSWGHDISDPDPVKREKCKQYVLFSLDIAKTLGKYTKAVIHPSFEPIKPEERDSRLEALRESLKELGPIVEKEYGCRLAVEDLPRTCLGNSSKEMQYIIGDIPSVDVCFDVNHLLGEKSESFGYAMGSRIKTIHIADYDEKNERHWLPKKGVINWNLVIDALVKANYDGPFMFEITKTPWGDNMRKFLDDCVASWNEVRDDYTKFVNSKK